MLNKNWHYHFLGIGGVGMSAVAEVMHQQGYAVSGSDKAGGEMLEHLAQAGITVSVGHEISGLNGADAVVYTTAMGDSHPIWEEVERLSLPRIHRAEALGALTEQSRALAVCGTHGKTTTSAALAWTLLEAGWDPTFLIGGQIPQFSGRNNRVGNSEWMVVEADESDGSFVHLSPKGLILTNVEADHLDRHGTLENVVASFSSFLERLPEGAPLIYCGDDSAACELAQKGSWETISYGFSHDVDVRVEVKAQKPGSMEVEIHTQDGSHGFISPLGGMHNALNLCGVFALCLSFGMAPDVILKGLASFSGVARRQQFLGAWGGYQIFDDYAHHPTEIKATLEMFRQTYAPSGHIPITVVYQPHLYSRTAFFAIETATALESADHIFLTDIYAAREAPIPGVSSALVLEHLQRHPSAQGVKNWQEAGRKIAENPSGGILITMGAGDITGLGPVLLGGGNPLNPTQTTQPQTVRSPEPSWIQELKNLIPGSLVLPDYPLEKATTLRMGGPADALVELATEKDLEALFQMLAEKKIPWFVLGKGSNLMVREAGFRGVVIRLGQGFQALRQEGENVVYAGGALANGVMVNQCQKWGFSGAEFLVAVPGSIGGAVAMNAGAHKGEIAKILARVRFYQVGEGFREVPADSLTFSYRSSELKGQSGRMVLGAWFHLLLEDPDGISIRIKEYHARRRTTQPRDFPNCGSVFKNPPGDYAARLIESAGLKGKKKGAAQVSEKHANFIVNRGGATASEVLKLIEEIQETVQNKFGVPLELELQIL